jgi:hypothetical protein
MTCNDLQVFSFVGRISTPDSEHWTAEQDINRSLGPREISDMLLAPIYLLFTVGPAVRRFATSISAGSMGG